ncbi:sce7726 family protein [Chitinophagaceae bacterium LB-8]|uniref:Sce7726 family protein n=1 Tax=Paraflavisolibacter caeni TaxID=2982496 RepID=A0A9X2XWX1_9BACT|nr:sce7726 family protein [Paraflavisolibacter caeni]MCU7550969.1 sce7726 family protein [Paraflavisolibacter caeni]
MESGKHIFHHLSQIFTASTFRNIIQNNNKESYKRYVVKNMSTLQIDCNLTNLEVIKKAYKCLNNNYRNEYLYKNTLFNNLIKNKKLKDTIVLNELRIDKSIADTVFINGEAVIYEIKTELDNSDKLLSQIFDYKKAFSKVYVVTHESIFYKYYQLIKGKGVGLIYLNDKNKLVEHTPAIEITEFFEHTVLFKLLRKSEYTCLIKERLGYIPDVPNTQYFKVCLELCKSIPVREFQKLVMLELKKRVPKEFIASNYNKIPHELRYICHTLNLRPNDFNNLFSFLSVPFKS